MTTRNAATGYVKLLEPALAPNSTDVLRPHSDPLRTYGGRWLEALFSP